jgi:DNA mismatch repair protein MutS
LERGAASRSYGVAVAKLAGLPESVLARARAILVTLESEKQRPATTPAPQLGLFAAASTASDPASREVVDTIRALDPDRLTGIEALKLLARLRAKLRP